MTRSIATALAFTLLAGCSAGLDTDPEQVVDQLVVNQHDDTTFDATLTAGGSTVQVLAVETEPQVVDITFDFGAAVIAFRLDYAQGVGDFMPAGAPLDTSSARLLDTLLARLADAIPAEEAERTVVEEAVIRQTSLMQIVPTGEQLTSYTFVSERGWTHISCSCYNQYIGSGYYRTCGRGCSCGGGNGCKGRCGSGCDPWYSGSSPYTRDCAKHDWGVGSWTSASDDFSFASNNCSAKHC